MNARERLLRYLEQRRELGETELVLDSMPVEDVMRLLGARASRTASGASSGGSSRQTAPGSPRETTNAGDRSTSETERENQPAREFVPPPPPPPRQREQSADVSSGDNVDWRTALGGVSNAVPAKSQTNSQTNSQATPAGKPSTGGEAEKVAGTAPSPDVPVWLAALGIPIGVRASTDALRVHRTEQELHIAQLPTLDAVRTAVAQCRRCALHLSARNPVPGEGNPNASFVCVGEAPGQSEDEQGVPFVGAAGQLLTKILAAIKFTRDDVFICNVLKHRPPGNRDPLPDEVLACAPYLLRQLELVRPRVILALGSFAARTLLGTETSIGKLRGKVHLLGGIPLVVTYHPAALLRNESWKRPTWEDVQLARRIHDAAPAVPPSASSLVVPS